MTTSHVIDGLFHDRLRRSASALLWIGLAMVVIGIAALVFPMISTLVATIFVGWVFLIAGGCQFLGSFSIHGTGPFFGALLFSLLSIAAGVFLVFNPFAGEVALTLVVGVLFVFQGTSEIAFALEMRPLPSWIGVLISGIASIVLAVLIAAGWPAISLIGLGILLGVNFVSTGLAYIFVSRALKPAE